MNRLNNRIGTIAFVGLGSNIGDRERYLEQAVQQIHEDDSIRVLRCSDMYETAPVGYVDQPSFLNMAIALTTAYPAETLLRQLLAVEQTLGRVRDIRWGPRTIDLDLLLYGDHSIELQECTVPHPRMLERAFVLIPLMQLLQEEEEEGEPFIFAESIKRALGKLEGKDEVRLWKKTNWHSVSGHFEN